MPDISGDPGANAPSDVEDAVHADQEVEPGEIEPPTADHPRDPEMDKKRETGKAALKAEAKSKRHMLTHIQRIRTGLDGLKSVPSLGVLKMYPK